MVFIWEIGKIPIFLVGHCMYSDDDVDDEGDKEGTGGSVRYFSGDLDDVLHRQVHEEEEREAEGGEHSVGVMDTANVYVGNDYSDMPNIDHTLCAQISYLVN